MFKIFLLKIGYEIQIKLLLNNHQNMTELACTDKQCNTYTSYLQIHTQ